MHAFPYQDLIELIVAVDGDTEFEMTTRPQGGTTFDDGADAPTSAVGVPLFAVVRDPILKRRNEILVAGGFLMSKAQPRPHSQKNSRPT